MKALLFDCDVPIILTISSWLMQHNIKFEWIVYIMGSRHSLAFISMQKMNIRTEYAYGKFLCDEDAVIKVLTLKVI